MAKFLMVTVPVVGHFNPGVPIARALVARGHQVRWYTGKSFRKKIEEIGAEPVPMSAALDYAEGDLDEVFPSRKSLRGFAQFKFDMKRVFTDTAPDQLADLEAEFARQPADAVLHDTASLSARFLAERKGVPLATYGISALTQSSIDTAPFGTGLLPSTSRLGRLRNRLLNWGMDKILFRDVQANHLAVRREVGLPSTMGGGFFDAVVSPYLYLQTTIPAFEYPRSDLPRQIHFVGPFAPEAPSSFDPPSWWNEMRPGRQVIHVTQGTAATDPQELLAPAISGLAAEEALVVATTGGRPIAEIGIDPLPKNARVATFLPYFYLLPHVDAMVTNGGYGGVQMALAQGIPLVVAGASEEKPEIARRIAWSGVGIDLRTKHPTPAQVREAVREVLSDPRYRRRAQEMKAEIAGCDPAGRSVELLEKLARTGKPVYREEVF